MFAKSGVRDAQAHRFRHTLATQILVAGGTIEDSANILGESPEIIRKHYAKWSTKYQRRTEAWHVYGTRKIFFCKSCIYNR